MRYRVLKSFGWQGRPMEEGRIFETIEDLKLQVDLGYIVEVAEGSVDPAPAPKPKRGKRRAAVKPEAPEQGTLTGD